MSNQSKKPTMLISYLLILLALFLALIGLTLGWTRGLNNQSFHSISLAIILAVALIILSVIVFIFSWRHSSDGVGKLLASILGILAGFVIILSTGVIISLIYI